MGDAERCEAYRDAVRDLVYARDHLARMIYSTGEDSQFARKAAEIESNCVMRLITLGNREED